MDEELDKNFEIRNFNASFSVSAIVPQDKQISKLTFLFEFGEDLM